MPQAFNFIFHLTKAFYFKLCFNINVSFYILIRKYLTCSDLILFYKCICVIKSISSHINYINKINFRVLCFKFDILLILKIYTF